MAFAPCMCTRHAENGLEVTHTHRDAAIVLHLSSQPLVRLRDSVALCTAVVWVTLVARVHNVLAQQRLGEVVCIRIVGLLAFYVTMRSNIKRKKKKKFVSRAYLVGRYHLCCWDATVRATPRRKMRASRPSVCPVDRAPRTECLPNVSVR